MGLGYQEEVRAYKERYVYFYVAIGLLFLVLITRLWYLQVYRGDDYFLYGENNRLWKEKDRALRGIILDRNGNILVDNRMAFDIIVRPQYLDKKDETITKLSKLLQIDIKTIKLRIADAKNKNLPTFYPAIVVKDADMDQVSIVESNKIFLPGVDVLTRSKRTYLYGESLAHVIGYIGEVNRDEMIKHNYNYATHMKELDSGDFIGKFGIEKIMDLTLRGIDGEKYTLVDSVGRRVTRENLPIKKLKDLESFPGKNIVLTIDNDLQQVAYEHFKKNNKKGAAVAIDPRSGEILLMVSYPSFDPTYLSSGVPSEVMKEIINNPYKPFFNKTIQAHYPPGSSFKPLVAVAGLEENVIKDNLKANCIGRMRFGRRNYFCHSKYGHGLVDLHDAILKSCNIFFYKLGSLLGVDKIHSYAVKFGLGKPTGVDLPDETTGLIPSSSWKLKRFKEAWQPGENLSMAIGQGFNLVTPIQMAGLYAGIATGKIYTPHVLKETFEHNSKIKDVVKSKISHEIEIKKENKEKILKALWSVVNEQGGTAWWYRLPNLDMAGKTGTAQILQINPSDIYKKCAELDEFKRHHGWFIGFAPYDNPEIVVAVLAEHACAGSSGAAPLVRDIIKAYYQKYSFERDRVVEEEYEKNI